jgi:hypothetical protein
LGAAELAVGVRDEVEGGRAPAEEVEDETVLSGAEPEEEEGRRIFSPAWIRAGFRPGLA